MRAIAMRQGAATGFSLGGSLTVIFLGAASGLAGGVMYAASRIVLRRHPGWARVAFGVVLMAITLRGLNPVDVPRLILFLPLFVAFGIVLDRLWERQTNRGEAIH